MPNIKLEKPLTYFQQTAKTAYGIIYSASEWMWNQLPTFSLTSSPIIQNENLEKTVDEELEKIEEINFKKISFVESIVNTAWSLANYAKENPTQTFALALTAYYTITNNFSFSQTTSENSEHLMNGIRVATNTFGSAADMLAKLAVAKFVTHAHSSFALNAMMFGLPFYQNVKAATGPEILVNDYTWDNQNNPFVTPLSNNKFLVLWEHCCGIANDPSGASVYGSIFNDTDGARLVPGFQVNNYTTGNQGVPVGVELANSNFIVAYVSETGGYGITYQIFNSTGSKVGSEFIITPPAVFLPKIANLPNGNFVIMWHASNQDGSSWGVFGQIFDIAGNKLGSKFQVNSFTAGDQMYPAVSALINGNYVVTWQSPQDGSGNGIFMRLFNGTGSALGGETRVNTNTTNDQSRPSIASFANGNYAIAWCSVGQDGSGSGTYVQLFYANGTKIGNEFAAHTYQTNDQVNPSVTVLSDDTFVVVWASWGNDGSGYGIYGQRFDSAEKKIGVEFRVNIYTTGDQTAAIVAPLPNGNFVVTWRSWGQINMYDSFARIFTPPHLINNTLPIDQGQTKTLTIQELGAFASNTNASELLYTISNITNGFFQLITNPGIPITSFTQQQIINEQIQFVHDGSEFAPAYNVKVNEVVLDTTPSAANIIFTNINDAPVLSGTGGSLNYIEKEPAILTDPEISVVDPDDIIVNGTISISNYYFTHQDRLGFVNQNGITGTFYDINGSLVLTGISSTANYQAALRNVTYFNLSLNPSSFPRTISFTINDGKLSSNTVTRTMNVIPVNDLPILTANTLTIRQGQTVFVTSDELFVTDPDDNQIRYFPSNVQHGRFIRENIPGVAILSPQFFTQSEIIGGKIYFVHDGTIVAPSYLISVSDAFITTSPSNAIINFHAASLPVIKANKLVIAKHDTVLITTTQLDVSDSDTPPNELIITISNLRNGRFSFVNNPSVVITSFNLQDIIDAKVQFTHDGADAAPAYDVSVSNGGLTTNYQSAAVSFILSPTSTPTPTSISIIQTPPSENNVTNIAVGISTAFAAFLSGLGIFACRKIKQAEEINQSLKRMTKAIVSSHQPTP